MQSKLLCLFTPLKKVSDNGIEGLGPYMYAFLLCLVAECCIADETGDYIKVFYFECGILGSNAHDIFMLMFLC